MVPKRYPRTQVGRRLNVMDTRILGLIIIALLSATLVSPALVIAGHPCHGDDGEKHEAVFNGLQDNTTLTFEEVLETFYAVRNETADLLEWAIDRGSVWASRIMERGEYHYDKAMEYKDSDPRLATAHLVIATLVYARSPLTAYEVLLRTLNETTIGENGTRRVTNETVLAVHEIAGELRELLINARDYALSINISLPLSVEIRIALGDELLDKSSEKLEENKTRQALALAIKGYRQYVIAYNIVVRKTISDMIGVSVRTWYELAYRLGIYRVRFKERLANFINKLPEHVKEYIKPRIGSPENVEELKARIKELVREFKEKCMEDIKNKITNLLTHHIVRVMYKRPLVRRAILRTFGNVEGLKQFIEEKVSTYLEQDYSLKEIVFKVLQDLKREIGSSIEIIIICPHR